MSNTRVPVIKGRCASAAPETASSRRRFYRGGSVLISIEKMIKTETTVKTAKRKVNQGETWMCPV